MGPSRAVVTYGDDETNVYMFGTDGQAEQFVALFDGSDYSAEIVDVQSGPAALREILQAIADDEAYGVDA